VSRTSLCFSVKLPLPERFHSTEGWYEYFPRSKSGTIVYPLCSPYFLPAVLRFLDNRVPLSPPLSTLFPQDLWIIFSRSPAPKSRTAIFLPCHRSRQDQRTVSFPVFPGIFIFKPFSYLDRYSKGWNFHRYLPHAGPNPSSPVILRPCFSASFVPTRSQVDFSLAYFPFSYLSFKDFAFYAVTPFTSGCYCQSAVSLFPLLTTTVAPPPFTWHMHQHRDFLLASAPFFPQPPFIPLIFPIRTKGEFVPPLFFIP